MDEVRELTDRLISLADCDSRAGEPLGKAMREAASEITRLRGEVSVLRSAGFVEEDHRIAAEAEIERLTKALTVSPEKLEAAAKALYERNPRYDQEVDADGRPTTAPYRIGWDELAEFDDGHREDIIEDARAAAIALGLVVKG